MLIIYWHITGRRKHIRITEDTIHNLPKKPKKPE
jgi:hypothetical protein